MTTLTQYRAELVEILGVTRQDQLPDAFFGHHVKVLKLGIAGDLCARYPSADPARVADWVRRYTGERRYLKRILYAVHAHDIDGGHAAYIAESVKAEARELLRMFRDGLKEQAEIMRAVR